MLCNRIDVYVIHVDSPPLFLLLSTLHLADKLLHFEAVVVLGRGQTWRSRCTNDVRRRALRLTNSRRGHCTAVGVLRFGKANLCLLTKD